MTKWKCGNCGIVYTFEQFIRLQTTKMVEEDTDPTGTHGHGYTSVCDLCGYKFFIDKWILHDFVKIMTDKGYIDIKISTVFLELNHGWEEGKELWYETMIFPQVEWLDCGYQNRYETKEEAIKDHDRVLDLLKTGKYRIEVTIENDGDMELVIDEDRYDILYSFIKALKSVAKEKKIMII